jgi:hypothetical protein
VTESSTDLDEHLQPHIDEKDTLDEPTQPGQQLPDIGAAMVVMATVAAFYRELALVQIHADALLSALGRREHLVLETVACHAAATWRVARAARDLLHDHASDEPGEEEVANRALDASRRLLLHLYGHVRATSAQWKFDVSRLQEVLRRLETVLGQVAEDGKTQAEPTDAADLDPRPVPTALPKTMRRGTREDR